MQKLISLLYNNYYITYYVGLRMVWLKYIYYTCLQSCQIETIYDKNQCKLKYTEKTPLLVNYTKKEYCTKIVKKNPEITLHNVIFHRGFCLFVRILTVI